MIFSFSFVFFEQDNQENYATASVLIRSLQLILNFQIQIHGQHIHLKNGAILCDVINR